MTQQAQELLAKVLQLPKDERAEMVAQLLDSLKDEGAQVLDIDRLVDDLAQLGLEAPPEEWAKLPPDLTDQLDHYVYGTPRK